MVAGNNNWPTNRLPTDAEAFVELARTHPNAQDKDLVLVYRTRGRFGQDITTFVETYIAAFSYDGSSWSRNNDVFDFLYYSDLTPRDSTHRIHNSQQTQYEGDGVLNAPIDEFPRTREANETGRLYYCLPGGYWQEVTRPAGKAHDPLTNALTRVQ